MMLKILSASLRRAPSRGMATESLNKVIFTSTCRSTGNREGIVDSIGGRLRPSLSAELRSRPPARSRLTQPRHPGRCASPPYQTPTAVSA